MSGKPSSTEEPGGFQPIDPWKAEDLIITRRNLPHFEVPRATYFVTLRCRSRVTLSPQARDLVLGVIRKCDVNGIDLDATVVMPDHVHLIFRIMGGAKLSRVLQRIKGRSSRQVNRIQRKHGPVWLDESFDHIIRHEAELAEKIEYVRDNPVKDGLAGAPEDYLWLYVKRESG